MLLVTFVKADLTRPRPLTPPWALSVRQAITVQRGQALVSSSDVRYVGMKFVFTIETLLKFTLLLLPE